VVRNLEVRPGWQRREPDHAPVIDEPLPRVPLPVRERDGETERMPPVERARRHVERREVRGGGTDATDLEPADQDAIALWPPRERSGVLEGEEAGQLTGVGVQRPGTTVGDERHRLGGHEPADASLGEGGPVGQPGARGYEGGRLGRLLGVRGRR
jgi:hypothetical protein